jgi:hypothetical protein
VNWSDTTKELVSLADAPDVIRVSYLITAWNRVFLEKINFSKLVKEFTTLYGTQKYVNAFKCSRSWTLPRSTIIQSIPHFPLSELMLKY